MKLPSGLIFVYRPCKKGTAIEVEQKELILCKDCRFFTDFHECTNPNYPLWDGYIEYITVDPDGYCYRAERMEEPGE